MGPSGIAKAVEIHAAPADPENLRLSAHRQVIVPVDHRFALGKSPALPSTPDKKSRADGLS
jgi:hypothetical protein